MTNMDKLYEAVEARGPVCVGLDTDFSYLPADFVLVDLDTPYTVEKEKLHSKSHNTPFDGVQLYGKVFATIKAGKITYQTEE